MFGVQKLEWFGYPAVKTSKNTTTRFDKIHERDRQTDRDRRTPYDSIGRDYA